MRRLRVGRSPWLEGVGKSRSYPSLSGRHDADVVIVGGGITGAAVAVVFAEAGVRVALLDAALVGRGSTAASTALLLREPDLGLIPLGARYGAKRARRIWEISERAVHDFIDTISRLGIDCDLEERETVYYTLQAEAVRALRAEYRRRCDAGFGGEWLTPGALRRRTALAGQAAILIRGNAQLDPYRACLGLLRAAADAGAAIFERSPARRIEHQRGKVVVVTPRGEVTASHVIVATGFATPDFRPLLGRFRMSHTYVLCTNPIDERGVWELGLDPVMLWDTERPYHYARWTPDRRLLLGGADRPLTSGRARVAAFRAGTQELRDYFERVLPALAEIGIDFAWEGVFAAPSDGLPYIGAHRRYPRHLFALGYGGNGMSFGFLAARMLLEQWRGEVTSDHALFAFGRHR